jgi:hypothetical protein
LFFSPDDRLHPDAQPEEDEDEIQDCLKFIQAIPVPVATQADVGRIALSLPLTEEAVT